MSLLIIVVCYFIEEFCYFLEGVCYFLEDVCYFIEDVYFIVNYSALLKYYCVCFVQNQILSVPVVTKYRHRFFGFIDMADLVYLGVNCDNVVMCGVNCDDVVILLIQLIWYISSVNIFYSF